MHKARSYVDFSFEQSKGTLDTLRAEIITEIKRYHDDMTIPCDLAVPKTYSQGVQVQSSVQSSPLETDLRVATESTGANSVFDQQHLSSGVSVSGAIGAPASDIAEEIALCSELCSDIENYDPNYDLIYGLPVSSVLAEGTFQSRPPLAPRRQIDKQPAEWGAPFEAFERDAALQRRLPSRVSTSSYLRQSGRPEGIAKGKYRSSLIAESTYRSKPQLPLINFTTPFTTTFDSAQESGYETVAKEDSEVLIKSADAREQVKITAVYVFLSTADIFAVNIRRLLIAVTYWQMQISKKLTQCSLMINAASARQDSDNIRK